MSERLSPEQLRAWLDRRPPPFRGGEGSWLPWLDWFGANGEYLGNRSGAVPLLDEAGAEGSSHGTATVGSESTKDTEAWGR